MNTSFNANADDVLGAPPLSLGEAGDRVLAQPLPEVEPLLSQQEKAVLETTSLGHLLCHLGELIFPSVILAIKSEFHLTPDQTTLLALLGYVLMGVGAVPAGAWADSWGCGKVLMVYYFLMGISGLAVAMAGDVWLLFGALTLLGLAASMYHPPALAMLSLEVRAKGKAMGINGVAGCLGIALAPVLGFVAVEVLGNWRWAYAILTVLSALFALRFALSANRPSVGLRPSALGPRPSAADHQNLEQTADNSRQPTADGRQPTGDLGQPTGERRLGYLLGGLLLLVMVLGGLNYRCLVTALPSYLSGAGSDGQLVKGGLLFTSLVLLAGGIGQILGGWMGDRFGSWRIYLLVVALLVPLSVLLAMLGGSSAAVAVAGLLAVALFAQQPVENAIMAETTTSGRRSLSYGAKFVLTFGVGAFGTQLVGLTWTATGSLASVFFLIALMAAAMATLLVLIILGRHRPHGPAKC